MTGTMGASALIRYGHELVERPLPELAGTWQRSTVFLARQALEIGVRQALERRAPGGGAASARAQLLCLHTYVSTPVAQDAMYLWGALSRACHQHSYELAPTADELVDWLSGVERVVRAIGS